MTFTPSSTSSFTAGAVFWGMVWSAVLKFNEIAKFLGFKRPNMRENLLRWVNKHKVVSLTATEAFNYGIHGITSPLGVTFALGGTLINMVMILFVVPIWARLYRLEADYETRMSRGKEATT